jgi:fucose permease
METYFGIGYTIVSTMFIAQCVGYIVAGVTNNRVTDKFGMGRVITAGAMLQTIAYAVVIAPPPFAVLPIAWSVVGTQANIKYWKCPELTFQRAGLGVAFQDAQANAWVAGLPNAHIKLVGTASITS